MTLSLISIVGCFLAAVSLWPYGLYVLLRCIVCGSTAYLAWLSAQMDWGRRWTWILGVTAIVFNPIAPLAFGRPLWTILDIACGLVLIIWLKQWKTNQNRETRVLLSGEQSKKEKSA